MKSKYIIGRKDRADFPELDLYDIDIKIDSGAYTSSIHCHNISVIKENGIKALKFQVLDPTHPNYLDKEYKVHVFKKKKVKSSNGQSEKRYVIKTIIKLFDELFPIELSLTERQEMKYPVLIGRKLLDGNFIIDPARFDISYRKKKVKVKILTKKKK